MERKRQSLGVSKKGDISQQPLRSGFLGTCNRYSSDKLGLKSVKTSGGQDR
jgi:hypothetical protein